MSSEVDKASDGEHIVNEQPIEISSESSNEDIDSSVAGSDTGSEISVLSSLAESLGTLDEQRMADEFSCLLALPNKRYKHYIDLCNAAFKLNVFEKIELAIDEFHQHSVVPPNIWLRYLKSLKIVTQTPEEHVMFQAKCVASLNGLYDEQLAEFVVKCFAEQPLEENLPFWFAVLADYCLERVDFMEEARNLLKAMSDKDEVTRIEKILSEKCVAWNCEKEQLESISSLIDEFKQKLKTSNENSVSWLQESFLLKAENLALSVNIKCSLAKLIFERSVAKHPTNSSFWLDYIAYMDKPVEPGNESKNHTAVTDGYLESEPMELVHRALKIMPSVALNHKYLQLMEERQYSLVQVDAEIEQHLDRIVTYMKMNVELQLDYLAYRVRHTDINDEEQVNNLRATFRHVWDRLSDLYGDQADTSFEVLQLWAQVEYAKLKNPENGAAIWHQIFNYPGSMVKGHLWLAYAQMESEYNKGLKVSTVLQQALEALARTPDANIVAEQYRRIERCFGSYKTISVCQTYCDTYMSVDTYRYPVAIRQAPKRSKAAYQKPEKKMAKKPPTPPPNESREPNFKYSASMEPNKIFIKSLYPACTKDDLNNAFKSFGTIKDIRLVYRQGNQRFKGIAYIEFEKPEEAKRAVISGDGLSIGGQNIVVAISNPPPKHAFSATTSSAARAGNTETEAVDGKRKPEKRRIQTSLIPTKLVINEVKRRKKLALDDADISSSTKDANGKSNANGNDNEDAEANESKSEEKNSTQSTASTVPKSNDDFRKLFNI